MVWKSKVALITGGSAGLGYVIAREFGAVGANVAIVGRDRARLDSAVQRLRELGCQVSGFTADVTDPTQAQRLAPDVAEQLGGLDVLVNNVGRSLRKELSRATLEDYRQLMDVNFLSAVSCTQGALPFLVQSRGHLVNIGSLSSKTAWPFMAPYSASKFALAAYTHQLRLEGPAEVHYMLVCPGPLQRDDAGVRYDSQTRGLPEHAREPAAGARVRRQDPAIIARKIIRGCEKRKPEILPFRAKVLLAMLAFSPRLGDWYLKRKMKD